MLFERGKYDAYYIMDLEDKDTQEELRNWIIDTYRDDDTFSEERVEETLESINEGLCEIWLDGDIIHIEVENGLGALDAGIAMVGI